MSFLFPTWGFQIWGGKFSLATRLLLQQLASSLDGSFTTELDKLLQKDLRSYLDVYQSEGQTSLLSGAGWV